MYTSITNSVRRSTAFQRTQDVGWWRRLGTDHRGIFSGYISSSGLQAVDSGNGHDADGDGDDDDNDDDTFARLVSYLSIRIYKTYIVLAKFPTRREHFIKICTAEFD